MVCLSTVGESYEFAAVSVDTVTRYSPYLTEKLFCDNLFKKDLNAEQENPTDFFEDVNLKSKEDSYQHTCLPYLDVRQAALSQKTSFEVAPDVDNVTVSISNSSKWKVMDMLQLRK